MMKNLLALSIILVLSSCLIAQDLSDLKGEYLGQTPPGDSAVIFAPGIVSQKGQWDEKVTFSPDGKEVFWGIHPDKNNYFRPYIMHAQLIDNKWTEPDTFLYTKNRKLGWPLLSPDGKMLFMEEVTDRVESGVSGNIVYSQKENGVWSEPVPILPKLKSKEGFGLAQITRDGTFYFYDRYDHVAYSARLKNGRVSKAEALPYTVNPAVEFFVSPDNDYIIFNPISWHTDAHISYKNDKEKWSLPQPLSDYFKKTKKGTGHGGAPSISPDGKYYFFTIWGEMYWVKSDFIEVLRGKAVFTE